MNFSERAVSFMCHQVTLYGIVSAPQVCSRRGVLIVVGGPQYRVGSHRQFTLLARDLAAAGVPVMRFDYRGMGDSEGEVTMFENADDDLRAAADRFFLEIPALQDLVIWGLCDGASAALFYAPTDPRVSGVVLLNPWVRTDSGKALAQIKHYYPARLRERELWQKVFNGSLDYVASLRAFFRIVGQLVGNSREASNAAKLPHHRNGITLPDRMRESLHRFSGKVLLIMSGRDLTAAEFFDTVAASREWQKVLAAPNVTRHELAAADHTFSRREWRDQVSAWSRAWIQSW